MGGGTGIGRGLESGLIDEINRARGMQYNSEGRVIGDIKFKRLALVGCFSDVRYTQACMEDSLRRGEAPIEMRYFYDLGGASDLLAEPDGRRIGREICVFLGRIADPVYAFYTDLGTTSEMVEVITRARKDNKDVELRTIEPEKLEKLGLSFLNVAH